jgi:hypothetical protein
MIFSDICFLGEGDILTVKPLSVLFPVIILSGDSLASKPLILNVFLLLL